MIKSLAVLVLLVVLGSLPDIAQAQPIENDSDKFVGMWKLESWQRTFSDGRTMADPRSVGYIVYTDTGHMCYLSMDPDRPKWSVWNDPTGEEAISAIMGIGAYCGRVEVDEEARVVTHIVEVEKVPNSVGLIRDRNYRFDGNNTLILSPVQSGLPEGVRLVELVWKRVTG
jgi:Lipocalin-like domain